MATDNPSLSCKIILALIGAYVNEITSDPVYSVAFSPNGEYLVSGSLDKAVHYWSLKEHKIVKTCTSNGGIFEVFWYKQGDKIAASFADNTLGLFV